MDDNPTAFAIGQVMGVVIPVVVGTVLVAVAVTERRRTSKAKGGVMLAWGVGVLSLGLVSGLVLVAASVGPSEEP